jgi:hypothetical protein
VFSAAAGLKNSQAIEKETFVLSKFSVFVINPFWYWLVRIRIINVKFLPSRRIYDIFDNDKEFSRKVAKRAKVKHELNLGVFAKAIFGSGSSGLGFRSLNIVIWDLFVIWSLLFGI